MSKDKLTTLVTEGTDYTVHADLNDGGAIHIIPKRRRDMLPWMRWVQIACGIEAFGFGLMFHLGPSDYARMYAATAQFIWMRKRHWSTCNLWDGQSGWFYQRRGER